MAKITSDRLINTIGGNTAGSSSPSRKEEKQTSGGYYAPLGTGNSFMEAVERKRQQNITNWVNGYNDVVNTVSRAGSSASSLRTQEFSRKVQNLVDGFDAFSSGLGDDKKEEAAKYLKNILSIRDSLRPKANITPGSIEDRQPASGSYANEQDNETARYYRGLFDKMSDKDRSALLSGMVTGRIPYEQLAKSGYSKEDVNAIRETYVRDTNARISQKAIGGTEEFTGKNAGTGIAGFAGARIGNLAGAFTGTLQAAIDTANRYMNGSAYGSTDPNGLGYLPGRMAGTADSVISDEIEGENGGLVRKGAAFVYRGAANAADNLARMVVATAIGGPVAGATVNSAFSFTQGFQGTYRDIQERGGNPLQGLLLGSIDGAMEVFTEGKTFERWMHLKAPDLIAEGVYEWLKAFGTSIGNEIKEEEASYIVNTISDAIIMADKSESAEYYSKAIADGKTTTQAWWELVKKYAKEIAVTAADTAVSTVLMNGATGVVSNYQYRRAYGGQSAEVVQEGMNSPEGTRSRRIAEKNQKKLDSGKELSGYDLKRQVLANEEQHEQTEAEPGTIESNYYENDSMAADSADNQEVSDINEPDVQDITPVGEDNAHAESDNAEQVEDNARNTEADETDAAPSVDQESREEEQPFSWSQENDAEENHNADTGKMDSEEQTIEQAAEKYGEQKGAMEAVYRMEGGTQDVAAFSDAYDMAYQMGKAGTPTRYLDRSAMQVLTAGQRQRAYQVGADAARAAASAQGKKIAQQANGFTGRKKGTVKGEGVTLEDLKRDFNDQQNRAYRFLSGVAEATGINIVLYRSQTDSAGNYAGAQGKFTWKDGTIYIDVNSGLLKKGDEKSIEKYAMVRTFSHEFTHFLEKYNAEGYNDFRKTVFERMADNGLDVDEEIARYQSRDESGRMTYEEASREVMADGMTDIFEDSQFLQKIAANNKNVFIKLYEKIQDFVADLKAYFKTITGEYPAAKALKRQIGEEIRYYEDIVNRFDEVAEKAVESYQKTVAEEVQAQTEQETEKAEKAAAKAEEAQEKETPAKAKGDQYDKIAVNANALSEGYRLNGYAYNVQEVSENEFRSTIQKYTDAGGVPIYNANFFYKETFSTADEAQEALAEIARTYKLAESAKEESAAEEKRQDLVDKKYGFTIHDNTERGTIEISFTEKPDADVRDILKQHKFRWSKTNKVWYGKDNRDTMAERIRSSIDGLGGFSASDVKRKLEDPNRAKAVDKMLAQAEKVNEAFEKSIGTTDEKTEEVTNNAENSVQQSEDRNEAPREDNHGGVRQSEQSGQGNARLLDEAKAENVQGDGQGASATDSPAGERTAGRDGKRPDSKRDEPGRGAGSSESGNLRDGLTSDEKTRQEESLRETAKAKTEQITVNPKGDNFVIGDGLDLAKGDKGRFSDNVAALKLIKVLDTEGRNATAEEQQTLSCYVGWGGLSNAFGEMSFNYETHKREMVAKKGWEKEFGELRQLVADGVITEDEYRGMSESTKNAHYTSTEVIRAMYDGLKSLGFQGGRMLEPSSGVGNFVGAMPSDMTATVKSWTMVELDRVTGQIAKYLYPNNDVRIEGFQDANIPDGFMDVAIGNVPFGDYGVNDRGYPKRVTKSIHNYFFAKSLDKVRTGGIVMFITSRFSMDAQDSAVRQYIMDRADLLGAIRLPDSAFSGNARTDVVTDILILKKRDKGTAYGGEAFLESNYKSYPNYVNEYFTNHPEMVLGTEAITRGMYGAQTMTYKPLENAGSLGDQIRKAFGNISGKMDYNSKTAEQATNESQKAERKPKEGRFRRQSDGTIINDNGTTVTDADSAKRIGGMIDVREAYRNLVERIQQGRTPEQIAAARKNLNTVYDNFVKENGYINDPKNAKAISQDPDRYSLFGLETDYRKGGKGVKASARKSDIFTKDTIKPNVTVTHADSVSDGLIVSVNTKGYVDADLIAQLTEKTAEQVERELVESGLAFKTKNGSLEAPETYLSGNVRKKLHEAEALAHIDKDFEKNVEALKRVIPKDVPYDEIHVAPGAVWVPTEVYADFIAHVLGGNNHRSYGTPDVQVGYSAQTGEFKIQLNSKYLKSRYQNTQEWGTDRRSFVELMEILMGNGNVTVTDKSVDADGKEHRVVNQEATAAAQEKADKIKEEFKKWIWEDETRRTELSKLYNETFNALATPKYDGKDLTVNGLNAMYSLREHQANAVKRIIASGGNTLLAHRVGAGKTLEMAAAAMKLRELGVVKKPIFAVPKSLVAQWGVEFKSYFPAAKLLVADDKSFDKSNRKVFTNTIANGDFDAVIVSYEQFGKIPMSQSYQRRFLQEQIDEIMDAIAEEKAENGEKGMTVKQMEKKVAQLKTKLEKLGIQKADTDNVDFETLGIDSLFVDEAHNFKNLQYTTRMQNVGGLGNADGSQRAFDLYTKIRYLQETNGGKGIVFATATPVMNSMAEMYIMQKYLQSDMLKQMGITTFDAWAKQFGEVVNTYEIKPSGQGVRAKQVFSNFKNLNELQLMFRSFSDVLTEIPGLKIPKMRSGGVQIVKCEPGKFQKEFMKSLEKRANEIKNVDPSVDNMLKITSDGRKVSYTQRMIDPSLPYEAGCKLYRCCENIVTEYRNGDKKVIDSKTGKEVPVKGTQIVFCDMATPKGTDKTKADTDTDSVSSDELDTGSAKLYEDMRNYLVKKGIPKSEIAFIHEADSDAKRKALFADMNAGRVRVLIGSTGKMGVGMNAQRMVTAIHHLDAPWRPGDVEQRDGRAFRQGNLNEEVAKYVYVTEGSFDARLWDILDRKSKFINQIMNGDDVGRNAEDTGDVTLSAAEVKALASGNPMIKESVELADEIQKLNNLKKAHDSAVTRARTKLLKDGQEIALTEAGIEKVKADLKARKAEYSDENFKMKVGSRTFDNRKDAGEYLMGSILKNCQTENEFVKLGSFAGFDLYAAKSGSEYFGEIRGSERYKFNVYLESTTRMVGQIAERVASIDTLLKAREKALENLKTDMAAQEKLSTAPFEKQAELDEKRKRYDFVMSELNKPDEQTMNDDEKEQHQERSGFLSDREVLLEAAGRVDKGFLTEAEKKELSAFEQRIYALDILEKSREDLGTEYREYQFGANGVKVDRSAAEKTREKMQSMDKALEDARNNLLAIEEKPLLRNVLKKSRKVIEEGQRTHDAENLKRWRERKNNTAAIAKYKARIEKDVGDMTSWVNHPGNKDHLKHVPDALKDAVIPFLSGIDFTSKRQLRGGDATKADEKFVDRIDKMQKALQNANMQTDDYSSYLDLPDGFMEKLDGFRKAAEAIAKNGDGDFVINQMTAQELKELSGIVKNLKALVQNFNRFYNTSMFQHVSDAAEDTIADLKGIGDSEFSSKAGEGLNKFLFWQQIRPAYAFERFGKGGKAIFDGFRRGQARIAFNANAVKDFTEKTYTDEEVRSWEKETKTVKLSDGTVVNAKVSQIMGFYETFKRMQGLGHIENSGVRFSTFESDKGKKVSDNGHLLSIQDMAALINTLTDRQKEVADKLQQFMAKTGGKWGNEVYMKRYGENFFTEEHYYPISVDRRNIDATADESPKNASLYALLNMSFTKELTEKAGNRIVVYSIFDVFANHMSSMAQYNAFALPVLDAMKWFNYRRNVKTIMDGVEKNNPVSVRGEMARVFGAPSEMTPGKGGSGYAEQFMVHILKAFNGTEARGDSYDAFGLNTLRRHNMAQVAYNFRVVVQQPLAITRAGMLVDTRNILSALKNPAALKGAAEEMQKYSGIAAWKALGFYDVNISRGLTDIIKHDKSRMEKIQEIGMTGAEFMDTYTWAAMWIACKKQVQRQNATLSGLDLMTKTADLFEEVVYKTQVVDSVLTKNEMLRSKSFFARSVSSFMGEPTTTASMLLDAYDKYRMDLQRGFSKQQAWIKNKDNITRTAAVYAVGALLLAAVQSVPDAMRDDDDDQNFIEKMLEAFWGNLADELMPFNKLPIVSDFYDLTKSFLNLLGVDTYGYKLPTLYLQWADTLLKGTEIIVDKLSGKNTNYTWYGGIYKLLQAASSISGAPMAAATREAVTIWNNTAGAFVPGLKVKTYENARNRAFNQYARPAGVTTKDFGKFMDAFEIMEGEDADGDGKTDSGSKRKKAVAFIDGMNLTAAQKDALYYSAGYKDKTIDKTPWHAPDGIDGKIYAAFLNDLPGIKGEDADGDGKTDSGSKRRNVVSYIDSLPLTPEQKDALYRMTDYSEKTIGDTPWHK